MARSWKHVFVVFWVDGDAVELRPSEDPNSFITIKEIVDTEAEAVAEVKRLGDLNSDKGARYFFQSAKYFTSGVPPRRPVG